MWECVYSGHEHHRRKSAGQSERLGRDLGGIVGRSHFRNLLALCGFATAFCFAYRYAMSFSHATASPFWFPDSVLLCALLLPNASGNFLSKSFRWVNVVHPDDRAARLLVTALIVGVAYYAGAWVGFTTTFPGPGSARRHIFWPPNVILLAALLVTAPRWRWPCSLTAFAAHLLVHAQLGVSPAVMALPVQFAGNVLQAVIADVKSGGGLLAPVGEATKAVDEARLAITSNCCG